MFANKRIEECMYISIDLNKINIFSLLDLHTI